MFSTFLTKEIATSKNIKNRINRQNVIRILTKIQVNMVNKTYINGVLIYCGIDNNNREIFELIEPEIECNIFYYNCGNKFITDYIGKFSEKECGSIIFVNGNETIIYSYNGKFNKIKQFNANLIKRHKKGGQSQKRFEELAEISRNDYVTKIIDTINELKSKKNWIFGSLEILNKVLNHKSLLKKLNNGGFLDFNNNTINDTKKFIDYLECNNNDLDEIILKKIVYYLDTDPDYLDFIPSNYNDMKNFIIKDELIKNYPDLKESDKRIKLRYNSKYYERLHIFDYIGLKYFSQCDYDN